MSKNKRLIVLLCLAALCSQCLYAQTRQMGIDEMFRLADEQSKSVQTYRTGADAADEALRAAKAQRLPDISVSLSASYLGDGRIWDRDFGNGMKVDMPHFGNNFTLEAQQVVYSGGAISSGIRQAELAKTLAQLDMQKNVQEIRFMLVGNYLDLYKLDNQMKVLEKNIGLTEQVIANMKARREQGTVLKNDITRYELQREQLKLQLSRVADMRKIANHQLATTLHLPEGTVISPDTTLLEQQITALTENDWQQAAKANNIDLKQAQASISMNEQKVRQERAELLPHIAIVAEEHLDGPVTIEVPALDNNFKTMVHRHRHKIQLVVAVQEQPPHEAGPTERAPCQGAARTGTRAGKQRRAGRLRKLPDGVHRPAHAGEQREAGRRELCRDQPQIQERNGAADRHA